MRLGLLTEPEPGEALDIAEADDLDDAFSTVPADLEGLN